MKPTVTDSEWRQAKDESDGMFNVKATAWQYNMMSVDDDYYLYGGGRTSPWINDFKVSRTLAGVQAIIDAGKTYPGALHRVVDDASNNGVYMIISNTNTGNTEYKRLNTVPATLIDNPEMTVYEAQEDYYQATHLTTGIPELLGINLFVNAYTEDALPMVSCKVAYSAHDIKVLCSPIEDGGEIYLEKNIGDYICLREWTNGNPNIYWLDKDTYDRESFHSLEWAAANPTVSSTITYQQAKDEYFQLFPYAKRMTEGAYGYNFTKPVTVDGHEYDKTVFTCATIEAFSIFNTFEAAQVCAIQGKEHYPGKLFSVVDDPDPERNGMYMVTCDITIDQEYGRNVFTNWGALMLTVDLSEHYFN